MRGNPPELLSELYSGERCVVWSFPNGQLCGAAPAVPAGLLSGAFNPLHEGHRGLRAAAANRLGKPVWYELPVVNADKPPLDCDVLNERRRQFDCPVALTRAATFAEKARLFPRTTFVVGVDTAVRILDPRFYGGSDALYDALAELRRRSCRFLVAGRLSGDLFQTLCDVSPARETAGLFEELPASEFRCDVSSTQLRRSAGGAQGSG